MRRRSQATRRHEYRLKEDDWERPVTQSEVVLLFGLAGLGIVIGWLLLVWLFTL